eukprot:36920_1
MGAANSNKDTLIVRIKCNAAGLQLNNVKLNNVWKNRIGTQQWTELISLCKKANENVSKRGQRRKEYKHLQCRQWTMLVIALSFYVGAAGLSASFIILLLIISIILSVIALILSVMSCCYSHKIKVMDEQYKDDIICDLCKQFIALNGKYKNVEFGTMETKSPNIIAIKITLQYVPPKSQQNICFDKSNNTKDVENLELIYK